MAGCDGHRVDLRRAWRDPGTVRPGAERSCPRQPTAAGHALPRGCTTEDGFCVIDVWDSQEAVDRFFQDKLGQTLQKATLSVQPCTFQVHNIMQAP